MDNMDCSTPGSPGLHYLPEFAQAHVHWACDAIYPPHPVTPFSSCPQCFPTSGSFPISRLFASGSQIVGASALVHPMNMQGWFLAVQGTLKNLLQHHTSKASILWRSAFFVVQFTYPYMTTGKTIALTINGCLSAKWHLCFLIHCLGLTKLFFQGANVF